MSMNNHEKLGVNLDPIGHYDNSNKESTIVILNAQIVCPSSADPKDLSINIYNANDNSLMASEKVTDVNLKGDVNPVVNFHCPIPTKQCDIINAIMIITKNDEPIKTVPMTLLPKPEHVEINVSEENLTEDATGSRINKKNEKIKNNQIDELAEKVALLSAKDNQREEAVALLSAKVSTLEEKVKRCHCRPNFPPDGHELLEEDKVAVEGFCDTS